MDETEIKQYDRFSKEFMNADESSQDKTRDMIYSLIKDSNLKGLNVLDLGCGYGKDLEFFKKEGCNISGIDVSSEMIKLARNRLPKANLKVGNFDNLPYKNEFFDIVFSRYAIQHHYNTLLVFKEVHRVLKKGGIFLFLVTHPLRQYLEKKNKDYWKQENITSNIIQNKIRVTEPSHIFLEYLSPFLLNNFELHSLKEEYDSAAEKIKGYTKYPGILILKYYKK